MRSNPLHCQAQANAVTLPQMLSHVLPLAESECLQPCYALVQSDCMVTGHVWGHVDYLAFESRCMLLSIHPVEEPTNMACCPPNAHGYLASSRDHKGTKITVSGGTEVYSTGALGSSGRAILICPDIWGWDSGRLRNIADHLADAGYLVVVPKILQPACVTTVLHLPMLSLGVHIFQAQWWYRWGRASS